MSKSFRRNELFLCIKIAALIIGTKYTNDNVTYNIKLVI